MLPHDVAVIFRKFLMATSNPYYDYNDGSLLILIKAIAILFPFNLVIYSLYIPSATLPLPSPNPRIAILKFFSL